jgi:uncharacterized protein with PIN domain
MFIDTSAFVALIVGEEEAEALAARLERAESRRASPSKASQPTARGAIPPG